jgi:hypothetical protein
VKLDELDDERRGHKGFYREEKVKAAKGGPTEEKEKNETTTKSPYFGRVLFE